MHYSQLFQNGRVAGARHMSLEQVRTVCDGCRVDTMKGDGGPGSVELEISPNTTLPKNRVPFVSSYACSIAFEVSFVETKMRGNPNPPACGKSKRRNPPELSV